MSAELWRNRAPWTETLPPRAPYRAKAAELEAGVAIVGGGIAGIATAFFLLQRNAARVVLLEAGRIACGASGHNAGQLVTYFERPLAALAKSFGFQTAATAQREVDGAWRLLDELCSFAGTAASVQCFTGHLGMWSENHLAVHLASNRIRERAGLELERCVVSERMPVRNLARDHADLFEVVPQSRIQELLETRDERYRAVLSFRKGTVNSVALCESLVVALRHRYPARFEVAEHAAVEEIVLGADGAALQAGGLRVTARHVALCTNGYRNFRVENRCGAPIDLAEQQELHGTVAFMGAYFVPQELPSSAISYLASPRIGEGHAYFYVTRRPFEHAGFRGTLVAIGGPDRELADWADYDPGEPVDRGVISELEGFLRRVLRVDAASSPELRWAWHGLMGYTRGGVRVIGSEPRNPALLYNLGCNGVGLLPAISGGARIASIVAGETPPESAFDPR